MEALQSLTSARKQPDDTANYQSHEQDPNPDSGFLYVSNELTTAKSCGKKGQGKGQQNALHRVSSSLQ